MSRSKVSIIISIILILSILFGLSSCGLITIQVPTTSESSNAAEESCSHVFGDWMIVQQATCNEEGKMIRVCEKCQVSEQSIIAKTDTHVIVEDPEVPATCAEEGLTAGSHCSVCGKIIEEQQKTPKTDHDYGKSVIVVEATPTKKGTKKYTCKVCGHSYEKEYKYESKDGFADLSKFIQNNGEKDGGKYYCRAYNQTTGEARGVTYAPSEGIITIWTLSGYESTLSIYESVSIYKGESTCTYYLDVEDPSKNPVLNMSGAFNANTITEKTTVKYSSYEGDDAYLDNAKGLANSGVHLLIAYLEDFISSNKVGISLSDLGFLKY